MEYSYLWYLKSLNLYSPTPRKFSPLFTVCHGPRSTPFLLILATFHQTANAPINPHLLPYWTFFLLHRTHSYFQGLITPPAFGNHILIANQIDPLASEPVLPSDIWRYGPATSIIPASSFLLAFQPQRAQRRRNRADSKVLKRAYVDSIVMTLLDFSD